ncbi:SDR family oxidoreductase [Pollutimonas harenae]|uniref:SDR family oxidoreductase n=1 Tax=Pollutimonas harenae TaxID=657015 RepID=A0A853H104_9BURK|nr:SDR family oxidoreductase [Pollutimonas harenae]NYT85429.1 SDR family oxidoreductase [Pollutimonas harenae]TEA70523.1 SDR family oxidoreductase [Pollutimonas harenae]
MDLELRDKVVLVTGGSKGIGLACALAFAREGAKVAIASRSADNLAAARAELERAGYQVYTHAANLSDADDAQKLVDAVEAQVGPIAVLVNSAGAAQRYAPATLTPQSWRDAMDAKYFPYINAMDATIKKMVGRGKGAIVNIIGAGGKVASPFHIPGGSANAALMLASAGLANAWGSKGIRVNAINPGATHTERVQGALKAESELTGKSTAELLQAREQSIPLGRLAKPEEVADAALYLASERASYVTAALLTMDGGLHPIGA